MSPSIYLDLATQPCMFGQPASQPAMIDSYRFSKRWAVVDILASIYALGVFPASLILTKSHSMYIAACFVNGLTTMYVPYKCRMQEWQIMWADGMCSDVFYSIGDDLQRKRKKKCLGGLFR